MTEYHLRISVKHENANQVIKAYVAKFKPLKIICCYENKNLEASIYENYTENDHTNCKILCDNEINPHIHCYINYNKIPTKQTISAFFKNQPILKTKNVAGYYHKKQSKTTEENIIYATKAGHFVYIENFTEEEIKKYITLNQEINDNKKLSSKEKLYNLYIEKYGIKFPSSKFNIFKFIDEVYVLTFKKSPLAIGHKICYSIHIIINIYKNINNKNDLDEIDYNTLLADLYNIKYQPDKMYDIVNDQMKIEYLKNKITKTEINSFMEDKYYDMLKIQTQINNSHFIEDECDI